MLNAAHANRISPQLSAQPSGVVQVKMVEYQRAPRPFLTCFAEREALRQAAVDHRAASGAILVARPEYGDNIIDHFQHQGAEFTGRTMVLEGVRQRSGVRFHGWLAAPVLNAMAIAGWDVSLAVAKMASV